MEPLQIYYRVLGGLFIFVLVFWLLHKFRLRPKLTMPPELSKDELEEQTIKRQEEFLDFLNKHDKIVSIFLHALFGGVPFLIGMLIFNAYSQSDTFSFSTIQLFTILSVFFLGASSTTSKKDKNLYSQSCDWGLVLVYLISILFCGLKLLGVKDPHIFGSPVPKLLVLLLASQLFIFVGIFIFSTFKKNKKRT